MSRLAALKAATSLSDVARLLDFAPKALSYILYKQPGAKKYTTFQVPKRNGGQRTIRAPDAKLKLAQRRLSDLLQDCVDEITTSKGRKDQAAHGFKRGRSIITNAHQHRHRRYVFNLDLEDFFPSINFGRVRGFLMKNRDLELPQNVATVIAQIACHDNSLPQGSPCSPVISNLIAHVLDMRLVRLALATGCTYSRYADDLTFSTNKKIFPSDIAIPSGPEAHLWIPSENLQAIIEKAGFHINAAKTHLMYRSSRQDVTGLVVNEKVNVRWDYRHKVRAMVHRLVKTGHFDIDEVMHKEGQATVEKRVGSLKELHGMLGFIDSIDVVNKKNHKGSSEKISASQKVYQEFLMYNNFYAAEMPTIICEGYTDNIYLTHAIRSLAVEFPQLAEIKATKIRLKVRLYKYPRSSTARVLNLNDGGSGVLANFIRMYRSRTDHCAAPGLINPVVIVYDNDSGADTILSAIRAASGVAVARADAYVHVTKNLYAVATPLIAPATESKIEGYFDDVAKGTVIDGKTFNGDKNTFDTDSHYGKTIFARAVVQAQAATIDFEGFRPLLTNLAAAITAHSTSGVAKLPVV